MVDLSTLLTPALAFAGALLACLLTLRGAREIERRSLREETMRNVRWAAELGVEAERARARLGVAQLSALAEVEQLDDYELAMVRAALDSMEPRTARGEEA